MLLTRLKSLFRVPICALALTFVVLLLAAAPGHAAAKTAFEGQGMWIWYVSQAERGDVKKIIAKAKRYKIKTVFVKSSDGANWWKQWDDYAPLLKAGGLKVCAWQYVYGKFPVVEAELAARAANNGADCIVIDAEVEYKNRYSQARQYITRLRSQISSSYPVGFTSFAYPDFHPTVPYSVFLGPGGAQWNLPQMYNWVFPTTLTKVFLHTYSYNKIYQRPIHPLGQTYERVTYSQAKGFRRYVKRYRAKGYSWWVWHDTLPKTWRALSAPLGRVPRRPALPYPLLKQGYKSDMVRWCKLKLNADGAVLSTSLTFDAKMTAAVLAFQGKRGLPRTGQIDAATWPVLQQVKLPAPVTSVAP
jgi:hypothetical protein